MSDSQALPPRSRRTVLGAAAWSVPVIAVAAAAPAMAVSPVNIGLVFDGGGGTNGLLNSTYLNVYSTSGQEVVLPSAITLSVAVVGLNPNTTVERSFSIGSSGQTLSARTYDPATRTTTFTWTIAAGTRLTTDPVAPANPDILFSFGDGLAGTRRITNKIVVRSLTVANTAHRVVLTSPSSLPADSSVMRDYDQKAASPDGIY